MKGGLAMECRVLLAAMVIGVATLSAQSIAKKTPEQIQASFAAHQGEFDYLLGDWEFTGTNQQYGKIHGLRSAVRDELAAARGAPRAPPGGDGPCHRGSACTSRTPSDAVKWSSRGMPWPRSWRNPSAYLTPARPKSRARSAPTRRIQRRYSSSPC